MHQIKPLFLKFQDDVYPLGPEEKAHERVIVRAIVLDGDRFLFTQISRDDIFADLTYIETSGGGVEEGESLEEALKRELMEELGISFEILGKLGVVEDDYNLIRRHNIQHYFLVRKTKQLQSHLTKDEEKKLHLLPLSLTKDEAIAYYEKNKNERLTHLIYQREMPIFTYALEILEKGN